MPSKVVQKDVTHLDEEEEFPEEEIEEEEQEEEPGGQGGDLDAAGMGEAIKQLTKIAAHLTEQRRKDPLEQLLDGGGGSASSSETTGLPGSKKNSAALRALQKQLQENPRYIFQMLEANMQADFLSRPSGTGRDYSQWMHCPRVVGLEEQGATIHKSCALDVASERHLGCLDWWQSGGSEGSLWSTCSSWGAIFNRWWKLADIICEPTGTASSISDVCSSSGAFELGVPAFDPLRPTVGRSLHGPCSRSRHLPGSKEETFKGRRRRDKGWRERRGGDRCSSSSKGKGQSKGRATCSAEGSKGPVGGFLDASLIYEEDRQHFEVEGAAGEEKHQPDGIRLPGSRAGTFSGEKIFHALLRYLTRSSCRLGGYARSFCQRRFDPATRQETAFKSLFPMPLPYPEALRKGAREGGGRLAMKKAVCAVVIVLNYLYSNRPRAVDKSEEMNRPLNKRQWEGVRHFERLLEAWITVSPIGPEAMGRTAAKVETLEATILSLEQSGRALIGEHQGYFHPPELGQSCTHPRQRGIAVGKIRGSEALALSKRWTHHG